MKMIRLRNSPRVAMVDDHHFGELNQYEWSETPLKSNTTYAYRNARHPEGATAIILMHRQIMGLGPRDERQVDHADRQGLNNLDSNLRLATRSQNQANKARSRNSQSGFKGVSPHRKSGKWLAHATLQYYTYYLGLYATAVEAAFAYNLAAERLYGAFARPNLIPAGTINPERAEAIRARVEVSLNRYNAVSAEALAAA